MIFETVECEEKLGYEFNDKMLLRKCFTHASYAHEHNVPDNELLEFFGDAIIEYVVTEYLFNNARGDEGDLTVKRAQIVSKTPLLKAVMKLGIDKYILLGVGQSHSKAVDEKLYSSLYEAVVAGMYIDGGMAPVKKFIKNTIIKDFEEDKKAIKIKPDNSSKTEFQEYVQKLKLGSISYETLSQTGPKHLPEFRVVALLNGKRIAEGKGATKKSAEAEAAKKALGILIDRGGI